jgi:hypothetical protein
MQLTKTILSLICGVATGVTLVISCGDNYRLDLAVDAAIDAPNPDAAPAPVCDCPAAEPPLAGRFMLFTATAVAPAHWSSGQAHRCLWEGVVIGGSCVLAPGESNRNVTLMNSGFYGASPANWWCTFFNHESTPVTIQVTTLCLMPSP